MATRYRIVQHDKNYFTVERKVWWWPFWDNIDYPFGFSTWSDASDYVDYLRNKENIYPIIQEV